MSELLKSGESSSGLSLLERRQVAAASIGACVSIQLGQDVSLADLLTGTVPFSESSRIYDQSGVEIDTAELLTHVEAYPTIRREV